MWCYYTDEVFPEFNMKAYVKQSFHLLCDGVEPYIMSKEEHNFKVYENQSGRDIVVGVATCLQGVEESILA